MERRIQDMLEKLNKDAVDTFVSLMGELKQQRERTLRAEHEFRQQQKVLREVHSATAAMAQMMQDRGIVLSEGQEKAIKLIHPHLPDYKNYVNMVNGVS